MPKNKLDKILDILREEMMTANPPGGQGGYSSNPPKEGVAGFDPVMDKKVEKRKRKPTPIGRYRTRVTWMKKGES